MAVIPNVDRVGAVFRTHLPTNVTTLHSSTTIQVQKRATLASTLRRPKPVDVTKALTPHSGGYTSIIASDGACVSLSDPNSRYSGNSYFWLGYRGAMLPQRMKPTDLDGRLRAKVKDQSVNLAMVLAEYRRTATEFARFTGLLYKLYRAVKPKYVFGNIVGALQKDARSSRSKDLASAHLSVQFSIIPTLSDVIGGAEAIAKAHVGGKIRRRASLHTSSYASEAVTGAGSISAFVASESLTESLTSVIYYDVECQGLKHFTELGLFNPAALAWELIPFSWLVDYAINVGEVLESWDALWGTSNIAVSRTLVREVDTLKYSTTGSGRVAYKSWNFSRTVDSSLALPRLVYNPSASWKKIVNSLSVLRQLR